eukprot:GHVS01012559.1.p1 GENE.GHVS01012559.1~~GHVS01012559.1.p1  ORF type:complete len:627 (+),score=123.46 GHVS01012559.1:67-1947(+)
MSSTNREEPPPPTTPYIYLNNHKQEETKSSSHFDETSEQIIGVVGRRCCSFTGGGRNVICRLVSSCVASKAGVVISLSCLFFTLIALILFVISPTCSSSSSQTSNLPQTQLPQTPSTTTSMSISSSPSPAATDLLSAPFANSSSLISDYHNYDELLIADDACLPVRGQARLWDPQTCQGSPYLYLTYHGGGGGDSRRRSKTEEGQLRGRMKSERPEFGKHGNEKRSLGDKLVGYYTKSPPVDEPVVVRPGGSSRVHNVCQYSRDGCVMGSVLLPAATGALLPSLTSLRGLLLHDDHLYVADSYKDKSRILVFGKPVIVLPPQHNTKQINKQDNKIGNDDKSSSKKHNNNNKNKPKPEDGMSSILNSASCQRHTGGGRSRCLHYRREFLRLLTEHDEQTNPGLVHPYGFAKHSLPYIYVSAQGTSEVLRYQIDGPNGGVPAPLSAVLKANQDKQEIHPGVFAMFRNITTHTRNSGDDDEVGQNDEDEIRGICFDKQGNLYVANKQKGVIVVNEGGQKVDVLSVPSPISVFFDEARSSVWVGCSESHSLFEFLTVNGNDGNRPLPLVQTIAHETLRHPAGFTTYGDSLFVASQGNGKLLEFSKLNGTLIKEVLTGLPDGAERILLTPL